MLAANGKLYKYVSAIALLIFLIHPRELICQERSILDSAFTFRAGTIKTSNALNIITKQTGYHFTYDSRLIDAESKKVLIHVSPGKEMLIPPDSVMVDVSFKRFIWAVWLGTVFISAGGIAAIFFNRREK